MRFAFAALLALALGLMPAGTALAAMPDAPEAPMACHDMGGMKGGQTDMDPHPASKDMQGCARHCLSQVNAQVDFSRLPGPSLQAAIDSEVATFGDVGKPRLREPPDPPPPRI